MVARSKPNEIRLLRVYEAPVQMVWDAWTDPEQVKQWWGPRGFTLTHHSKELRPGGIWRYTMHGPDGVDYPNVTLYHEVEPCKKLVYDHGATDDRPPMFRVTVLFSESDGKTTIDMTMALPSAEEAAAARKFIKEAGGNATWDRLAEFLHERQDGHDCFVINRSFDVSEATLFEMWTDPGHLAKWLPPAGLEMEFLQADIRQGGSASFRMTNGADFTFYGRFDYEEVRKPARLVYVMRFCDAQGQIARHPVMPTFPAALKVTAEFSSEGEQASRITVTMQPYGPASADETSAFLNERPGMTLGWTGSFDKLESLLAERLEVA